MIITPVFISFPPLSKNVSPHVIYFPLLQVAEDAQEYARFKFLKKTIYLQSA